MELNIKVQILVVNFSFLWIKLKSTSQLCTKLFQISRFLLFSDWKQFDLIAMKETF